MENKRVFHKEIHGVVFRSFCLVLAGGNKPYNKRFDSAELKALSG